MSGPGRAVPSARGLFRAMGHVSAERARAADDFYPTPPEPVRALLSAERAALDGFPTLWEPAAGDGAMVRELALAGHRVISSDIVCRGGFRPDHLCDFFAFGQAPAPAIITNPPYCEVNWRDGRGRWIEHALGHLDIRYMALLLNWSWPSAGGLAGLWQRFPPARVYLMRWKIDFTGEGAPPMLSAWFIWDRRWRGEPVLRMLDRSDDARQGEMALAGPVAPADCLAGAA